MTPESDASVSLVFANDLPYAAGSDDPLRALGDTLAFAADDWSTSRATAWIYGIVLGWDDAALAELAAAFRWTDDQVARLHRLHAAFQSAAESAPRGDGR